MSWFFPSVCSVRISVGSFSFTACLSSLNNKFCSTGILDSTFCIHLFAHTNFSVMFYSVIASCYNYIYEYLKSEAIISSVCLFMKVAAGKSSVDEG